MSKSIIYFVLQSTSGALIVALNLLEIERLGSLQQDARTNNMGNKRNNVFILKYKMRFFVNCELSTVNCQLRKLSMVKGNPFFEFFSSVDDMPFGGAFAHVLVFGYFGMCITVKREHPEHGLCSWR